MPHQRFTCSGLLIASKTRCLGALNTRLMTISRSEVVVVLNVSLFATLLTAMLLLLCFHFLQVIIETIETCFPDVPVTLRPRGDFFEWSGFDAARAPLRFPSAADQTG